MKYTKELIESVVITSQSIAEVCRKLQLPESGGAHGRIRNIIKNYGISTSHFKKPLLPGNKNKKPWQDILILSTKTFRTHRDKLLRAMLEYGFKYKCNKCGMGDNWCNERLTLEIEHINENGLDNRPENLQFLCPNCHSQKSVMSCSRRVQKQEYTENFRKQKLESYEVLIQKVLNANIDFSKRGCLVEVGKIIGKHSSNVKKWMTLWMPDFYNNIKDQIPLSQHMKTKQI